jgi:DNA-binding HxlR family transcriptional regulator
MPQRKKHLTLRERSAYHRLEDVIGCKWSAGVVAAIEEGVCRPGELERYVAGISKKILNERLRKLREFGILTREEIPGSVPHVEYKLTRSGKELARILQRIRDLQHEMPG